MTDCSRIRDLLSEYLDNALEAKERALAEEHLRTCSACRQELESLRTLVQGLGSIPSVKAPADFLDQLHKRMERPAKTSRWRGWIFYPLRVKLPLQLAGAAVAAFLIFSVFPLQQSSLELPVKPVQENKDSISYTDEAKGTTAPAKEIGSGKPADRSVAVMQKAAVPEPAKRPREVALNLKLQVRAKAASAEPSAAPAPTSPAVQDMKERKLAAEAPVREDKKEEQMKKEMDPVLSIRHAVQASQGKVLSVDRNPQTGRPEALHAEIPAGEISRFYQKLRELGELHTPPEPGAEKDSDLVPVTIRIVGLQ